MILIRQRLQAVLEDTLTKTQCGFRASRSTSHALFLTRRISDWEKAFDTVHEKLYVAFRRLGVHQHFLDVIRNCYSNPWFFVEDEFGTSSTKRQAAGIRQGCPLPPYLFVLVRSVIDHDISHSLDRRTIRSRKADIEFDRIYYADDTILLATNTYAATKLKRCT